ncbi:MAG: hypothetical protein HY704_05140 [Gemmatimonadetes bacterium]|nr:hypothetical protein [Gemmatimonadota bacterium]
MAIAVFGVSCSLPEPASLPPGHFAFGVFGDGPYRAWEIGRFRHVIEDASRADLQWFLHVGDILWYPCSNEAYADRLEAMNSLGHPVVYTPGDNEWADCHEDIAGAFQPLDRLQRIRTTFFANPRSSLGARVMRVESQSEDPDFTEFVENARWQRGGFLFATIHMVGSGNASAAFAGRTSADDREVARRTRAALAWLEGAFRMAGSDGVKGVVLALHGNPGLERGPEARPGYGEFVDRLEQLAEEFAGPVLLIHGDSHTQRVDHPLVDRETGHPLPNFTRLETYGSPDIGWVRVVADSVAGRIVQYEPRLMPAWWLW